MRSKKIKNKLIIGSSLISLISLMPAVVSCSKNETRNIQTDIDKQYEIFNNSLVRNDVDDNIYFENFNFVENRAELSINEISNYISIQKLSNFFDYKFVVTKESSSKIKIEMQMKEVGSKDDNWNILKPTDINKKYKTIDSVKSLTSEQSSKIVSIYENWEKNGLQNITIKNVETNELLDSSNYKNVLPSYLSLNNIKIDIPFNIIAPDVNVESLSLSFDFNDIEGKIDITLNVQNYQTGLDFFLEDVQNKKIITISGFEKQENRNNEIQSIYGKLGQTINLNSVINDRKIPALASGITNVDEVKVLYEKINEIKENEKVQNIISVINEQDNSWYSLSMTSTANDISGTLNIDWTITEKFTGYKIRPQNISKISTINEMLKLEITEKIDDKDVKNTYQLDNVYNSYQLFNSLLLKDKYKTFASDVTSSQIDNNWIINNTNIKDLFPDLVSIDDYIYFSKESGGLKNNFRFKILNEKNINANNISGILDIDFSIEIQINENFDPNIENESEWIKVLPPNGITINGSKKTYNSASRSATIKVGGFLNEIISNANLLYSSLSQNNTITINIANESYFQNILSKCAYDESQIFTLLETEIKNTIISRFSQNNEIEIIEKLLDKYEIYLDLTKNEFVSYNKNLNQFSTSSAIEFKLQSTSSNSQIIDIPYYENGILKDFPKVIIIVKYTK